VFLLTTVLLATSGKTANSGRSKIETVGGFFPFPATGTYISALWKGFPKGGGSPKSIET
jgi:hypothetical protein